ncbi:MAG: undecaprenyldiphospho-muramoylpentapeptide beta-N-acetylglucosaminyltransferase [Owenweeksia sp.]|nr:undecaprenyldiphospho-muramoylpentapeptide beta-N-acetylglucosaminyltransferase [Owenweeksia sp.]|tara:strand:+ start:1061 stop:2167 length:1107 start_codon:yes stop_codon:yes gene_type:complete
MPEYQFMISGGGTGGHIFPAVAIADELKKRYPDAQFLFVGARDRMEMERVPQAGYNIEGLWISGIQRKLTASNLLFPFKLFSSITRCQKLIRKFKPDVVIGTGGFASGPLLYVASRKNKPCLIQEQNSFPGITNKLLAPRVNTICVAYDKMERFFPQDKIVFTGNPIRSSVHAPLASKQACYDELGLNPNRKTLLVLGGSLGARKINQLVENNLNAILEMNMNLLWQSGKLYIDELLGKHGSRQNDQLQIKPFLQNMQGAYAIADGVISRAGAGTLSELAVLQKPSLLIPSPNVAEDHQTKNAMALVEKGAALIFRETDPESQLLEKLKLLMDGREQEKLQKNIQALAKPKAAEHIVDEIEKLLPHAE